MSRRITQTHRQLLAPQFLAPFHSSRKKKNQMETVHAVLPVSPQAPWRSNLPQHGLISGEHSSHQSPRAWVWQPAEQRSPLCFHSAPVFCVLFVAVYQGMAAQPCSHTWTAVLQIQPLHVSPQSLLRHKTTTLEQYIIHILFVALYPL